jgi:hypothetical protein
MFANSFTISLEWRVIIRFFTLKRVKARAIHTELDSVHSPEALVLSTVRKCRRRLHQRRTNLFDDLRSGSSLTNDIAGAIHVILEERPSVRARYFVATP